MSPDLKKRLVFHGYAWLLFSGYAVFFLLFHQVFGSTVALFAFIPALVVAWIGGMRAGIFAGIAANVVTGILLHLDSVSNNDFASIQQGLPGIVAIIIIAAIVGYMRELRQRLKKELDQKIKTEADLRESESRFKAIFEGSNDALMLFAGQSFFDCNLRTLEMFGFKNKEEFTRIHPADISPPRQPDGGESFPAAQERIKTAFEQGSNRFEWIHRKKNGEDFPAEVLLSAFSLNGKRVLQATVRDISERKQAEEALAESEKSFRSMFEMTSEGVVLISPRTGRIIAANPAMCAMFSYTEEEFQLLTAEDITPSEAKEIMRNSMSLLFAGGIVPDHEGISVRKNGTHVNVLVSCRQLLWKGEPVFYVTFKDISFLKDIYNRLQKKNIEILEYTNMVTHDLKKPLTSMKTICSMTKKNAVASGDPDFLEMAEIGAESIRYMQEMLDDLLACAKLEAGTQELALEEVRCREVLKQVERQLKYAIEDKKINLDIPADDLRVKADPKQLTRVFMNLIGNAINYIGEKPDKKIIVWWEHIDGCTVFTVRDNGIGIPPETQGQLFTKFKRGTNVSGIGGTGLGLSIVKGIILAHGGKIWFESKEGEGTAFHFTLGEIQVT
jgi:PAS domain S-box-containing protein